MPKNILKLISTCLFSFLSHGSMASDNHDSTDPRTLYQKRLQSHCINLAQGAMEALQSDEYIYRQGIILRDDKKYEDARECFGYLAEKGDAKAAHNLARCYQHLKEPGYKYAAYHWYQKAAEAGLKASQKNLVAMNFFPLMLLPEELIVYIGQFLTPRDIGSLKGTSKWLRFVCEHSSMNERHVKPKLLSLFQQNFRLCPEPRRSFLSKAIVIVSQRHSPFETPHVITKFTDMEDLSQKIRHFPILTSVLAHERACHLSNPPRPLIFFARDPNITENDFMDLVQKHTYTLQVTNALNFIGDEPFTVEKGNGFGGWISCNMDALDAKQPTFIMPMVKSERGNVMHAITGIQEPYLSTWAQAFMDIKKNGRNIMPDIMAYKRSMPEFLEKYSGAHMMTTNPPEILKKVMISCPNLVLMGPSYEALSAICFSERTGCFKHPLIGKIHSDRLIYAIDPDQSELTLHTKDTPTFMDFYEFRIKGITVLTGKIRKRHMHLSFRCFSGGSVQNEKSYLINFDYQGGYSSMVSGGNLCIAPPYSRTSFSDNGLTIPHDIQDGLISLWKGWGH